MPSTDGGVSCKDDALGQKCVDKRADKICFEPTQFSWEVANVSTNSFTLGDFRGLFWRPLCESLLYVTVFFLAYNTMLLLLSKTSEV